MVMPSVPATHLIIPHPAVGFAVLKVSFNPVSLCLHMCKPYDGNFLGCIAQAILDFLRRIHFAANDETPLMGSFFLPIPDPDIRMKDINEEMTFRCLMKLDPLPFILGVLCDKFVDSDRLRLCFKPTGLSPSVRFCRRDGWLRIRAVNMLVSVDINNKSLTELVYVSKKRRIFSVKSINRSI